MHLICHAFPAWEGNYVKSTVELMKRLALLGHTVLYVDYAYTWKDFFNQKKDQKQRMLGIRSRLRQIPADGSGRLYVLTLPPVLPSNFLSSPILFDFVNRLNSLPMQWAIRRAVRILGMKNTIVVNAFNPAYGYQLAGKLGESKRIYYCYDEISAAHWAGKHGPRLERAYAPLCEAVICSSEGLQSKLKQFHPKVFVVKNGVDFAQFNQKVPPPALPVLPEKKDGQKVIGYLGSIDDRLDYEILENLFRHFSTCYFVFVGRVQSEELNQRLRAFSNVHLVGAHPATDLPGWVQQMDVCLIPFEKNPFTAGIYPLKVNEYLAAGKPVVSTRFAPFGDLEQVVFLADGTDFLEAVEEAMNQGPTENYQVFAKKNDWMERARAFEEILQS